MTLKVPQEEKMVETPKHQSLSSRWWWLDCPSSIQHKRSPWFQSAIAELDEKTKAMLNLIEEDADSFAQRAEMYYKKRPELITMVEDFYRTHRSLAERCDQLKSESRLSTPRSSSLLPMSKCQPEKLLMGLRSSQKDYDSYSETYELDESDVEDPYETITATPFTDEEIKTKWVPFNLGSSDLKRFNEEEIDECVESDVEDPERGEEDDGATNERMDELMKLKAEMDRLKEENMSQKEQIMQKDEEKREVIRQLSVAIDMLREENVKLKQRLAAANKESTPKKKNARGIEINKVKNSFWGRIFH